MDENKSMGEFVNCWLEYILMKVQKNKVYADNIYLALSWHPNHR